MQDIKANSNIAGVNELTPREYMKIVGVSGFSELILETTTACNMRCRYCLFSGEYYGFRTHGIEKMSEEIAKKALDMYFTLIEEYKYLNPLREPKIGFYGGEPLLNFELIKFSVEYSRKLFNKYNVEYTLTTNGTILSNEIASFLIENNFKVFISLDGPREEHDRNRVFADGKGSFDVVMGNIKRYNELARRLGREAFLYALATYDIKTDLIKLREFFNKVVDEIKLVFITSVRPFDTEYYSKFSDDELKEFLEREKYLEEEFLEYLKKGLWKHERDIFLDVYFGQRVILTLLGAKVSRSVSNLLPYGKPCLPPYRIYVTVNGNLLPCEKSPNNLTIGNVHSGIDYSAIIKIISKYQEFQSSHCVSCPIKYSCQSCLAIISPTTLRDCKSKCNIFKKMTERDIKLTAFAIKEDPYYILHLLHNLKEVGLYLM